jgi:hypothetical protein
MGVPLHLPKFSITTLASWIGAITVIVGGVFAFDARYNNNDTLAALNDVKSQVVSEVAVNRSALLSMLRNESDDLEFLMMEMRANDEQVPRHIIEKQRRIQRQIETLEKDEEISQIPSN